MKKKNIIIIILVVIALLGVILGYYLLNKNEEKQKTIPHKEVEGVYDSIEIDHCTNVPAITDEVSVEKMSDEVLSYLIFNQMRQDKVLKDEITKNEYETSAKKVLSDKYIPKKIENYSFDGYLYTMKDDKITREKTSCGNRSYVSKLYGYSNNNDKLEVDVRVGYIEDDTVYDLDGKELGAYDKDKLNTLLDQGTTQVYVYTINGSDYALYSIKRK